MEAPTVYIVQGSERPVFRCDALSGTDLRCSKCGAVLIDGYFAECFAGIWLKCFQCHALTATASIEAGETVREPVITLGHQGAYLMSGTVEYDHLKLGTLTFDEELRTVAATTAPRFGPTERIALTSETIRELEALYDELTGGKFARQATVAEKHERAGSTCVVDFPGVWALRHLSKVIEGASSGSDEGAATITALFWVEALRHVHAIWSHHPRYRPVIRKIGDAKAFVHTVAQLILAAYLWRAGNRIGFSLEDEPGPNPDLYLRLAQRAYIEVKAPLDLQWRPDMVFSVEDWKRDVKRAFKRRHQISSTRHGVVAYASSLMAPGIPETFCELAANHLRVHGRDRKSVAAIAGLFPSHSRFAESVRGIDGYMAYEVVVIPNPHYSGSVAVRTTTIWEAAHRR